MSTLLGEFKSITQALNDADIPYAVCGGWAMAIHGLPRATIDIDLLIATEDLERVWALAKEKGYNIEGLPLSFANGAIEIRRISKVDRKSESTITLDFLLVTEALRPVWLDREQVEWPQGKTWVVSREGLVHLKSISGRPQDSLDIERLRENDDAS
jgi:hypothetical protein